MSHAQGMTINEVVADALEHADRQTVLDFACDVAERTVTRYAKQRPSSDCTEYLEAIEKRRQGIEGGDMVLSGPGGDIARMMTHLQHIDTRADWRVAELCKCAALVEVELAGLYGPFRKSELSTPEYKGAMMRFRCDLWRRVHPLRKTVSTAGARSSYRTEARRAYK